ncbi:MAG TPA: ATP-grasp domain-containing protein [Microvirga sp.]|nr:ATP-grasp domain-containing protein [Microvirga sp.]
MADEDLDPLTRMPGADGLEFVRLGDYEEATDPLRCDPERFIAGVVQQARRDPLGFDGIIQLDDYPSSILLPLIARELGLTATSVRSVFRCEHKLWCRTIQRSAAPKAVPRFEAIPLWEPDPLARLGLPFPFWLKPVKSYMSYLGFRVGSPAEFRHAIARTRAELPPFVAPFNRMLDRDAAPDGLAHVDGCWLIAEELLAGRQCCLEGYVHGGEVTVLGIVDSIRLPNRVSFTRFEYPSRLPAFVQRRMAEIARRVVPAIGLDNTLFNIELFWDARREWPSIIEINSRMSAQFADLFQKVDGISTHEVLVDLALGRRPRWRRGEGRYRVAASFVLRTDRDRFVTRVPSVAEIHRARTLLPDLEFRARAAPGHWLSEWPQDSYTFRYGLIHVGGSDREDLRARFAIARSLLPFQFGQAQVAKPPKVRAGSAGA